MSVKTYSKIGIVGTGVIGASWAAYYLSRGYEVSATDPAPEAESKLRTLVESFWERSMRAARSGSRVATPSSRAPGPWPPWQAFR
jgi:3-hydroxyacyl-CoA dehydrogenase